MRLAPLLHAALRPGGRLLVQTANGAGLFPAQVIYGDLTHMTIFTPQSLDQLLRASGFVDLAFYETGPIPIRVRGKIDVALWTIIKALASTVPPHRDGQTPDNLDRELHLRGAHTKHHTLATEGAAGWGCGVSNQHACQATRFQRFHRRKL